MTTTCIDSIISEAEVVSRSEWNDRQFDLTVAVESKLKVVSGETSNDEVLIDTSGTGLFPALKTHESFEPRSDHAFVMGLMAQYNISLLYQGSKCFAFNEEYNLVATDSNPLKAALIIFLHIILLERESDDLRFDAVAEE